MQNKIMMLDFFAGLASGFLILIALWAITLLIVLITLYKRNDLAATIKIFWGVIIFIAPVLGLIVYLLFGLPRQKKLLDKPTGTNQDL